MKSFKIKEIKEIIIFSILLIFAFIYIKDLFNIIKYIIHLFMPFIVGLGIAFVLNVLVNVIEKKWFKNWQTTLLTKRTVSLILALTIVIGFLAFLLF